MIKIYWIYFFLKCVKSAERVRNMHVSLAQGPR